MKTITIQNLSSEEFATLQEMFSTVASLDFPFTESDEFDTLWDKVNDAE
jgi:hypothetical protein|tara:strand:+ start:476 stop:622 length:147 start_codon:yes stop_codon:yes gene_type:complete